MKAEELRVGNFIIYSPEPNLIKMVSGVRNEVDIHEKEYYRVFFIDNNMKDCRGKAINWIKPIPLTEEWLLKFGFRKTEWNPEFIDKMWAEYILDFGEFELKLIPSLNSMGFTFWLNENNIRVLKYVHQLQNICYALTGKEMQANSSTTT